MHKLLNILDLEIALKRFIFCSSLLEENPRALFLGLLSWKQKQNKKPDIRKVIFTERIPRSFASSPPPPPHRSLGCPHLFEREEEKAHSRVFPLAFRLLLCGPQHEKMVRGCCTCKEYSGYSCRFGRRPGKCVVLKSSEPVTVSSRVCGPLTCAGPSPELIRRTCHGGTCS